jgi:hypothetical protein
MLEEKMLILFRSLEENKEIKKIINRDHITTGVCIKGTNKRIRVKIGATDIDELRLPKKSITQDNIIEDADNITVVIKDKKGQLHQYTSPNYEIVDKNNIILNYKYGELKVRPGVIIRYSKIKTEDEGIIGVRNISKEGKIITCYNLNGDIWYKGDGYILKKFTLSAFFHVKYCEYEDHKLFKYRLIKHA